MIFYLRCAAYLCLLPRTRTQRLRAQTHSRRQAMLAAVTKINLPSCLGFLLQICSIYLTAPYATHATSWWDNIHYVACANIYRAKNGTEAKISRDYAISLYACVARSASCKWLITSLCKYRKRSILSGKAIKQTTEFHEFLREWERPLFQAWERARWKRRETRVVSV